MPEPLPIFVDASGRRRRLLRRAGLAAGVVLAGFLVLIGVGVATGSDVPLTPWSAPGASHEPAAGSTPGGPGAVTPLPKGGSAGPSARPSGTAPAVPAVVRSAAPQASTSQGPAAPAATATHPGRSHASPPARGKAKKTLSP
ncbi:hypothetical protein ACRYCC_16485 [Actinomadura scrupuli]|uniref:hypothetical protein n=1 Tax=Actinomadura scrupuli TaxID=559629 RepID=UPI003D9847CA